MAGDALQRRQAAVDTAPASALFEREDGDEPDGRGPPVSDLAAGPRWQVEAGSPSPAFDVALSPAWPSRWAGPVHCGAMLHPVRSISINPPPLSFSFS